MTLVLVSGKKNIWMLLLSMYVGLVQPSDIIQLKQGNLALPSSQQPGPLLGFGQSIVDQGDFAAYVFFDHLKGNDSDSTKMIPSILYGVTDDFSILISSLVQLYDKEHTMRQSAEVKNFLVQCEYGFYTYEQATYTDAATIVGNIIFPTRSTDVSSSADGTMSSKMQNSKLNSPSFFLGLTASRITIDWYLWASLGSLFTVTSSNRSKLGNQYVVQCGLGRNIPTPPSWILLGQVEFSALFDQKNKIMGETVSDSGGTLVYLGPSLWASNKDWVLQAGILFPLYQYSNGDQNKNHFLAAANIGLKF